MSEVIIGYIILSLVTFSAGVVFGIFGCAAYMMKQDERKNGQ